MYFDGLMNDVNKIKSEILEKTTADFKKVKTVDNTTHFTGKLQVVNAFGTNELLKLNAKIEQRICPETKRSYVLFKISPSTFKEIIWEELDAIELITEVCSNSR